MVERFNGRIADVLKTHHFNSAEDMRQTLMRYVTLYNHHLPQSVLKSKTPMQAMKDWYATHAHLFHRRPYNRAGCDTYGLAKQLNNVMNLNSPWTNIGGKANFNAPTALSAWICNDIYVAQMFAPAVAQCS